jgi:D-serine deaminase-like pyridoxal phosphate-dependent protein
MGFLNKNYKDYQSILKNFNPPYAVVDLDYLDKNIEDILKRAGNTKIRIASKSIRSINILKYIFSKSRQFQGIMSFTTAETLFLIEQGFNDILIGYPSVNEIEISLLADKINEGKDIVLMVDKAKHLEIIERVGASKNCKIPVCIDIDMSSKFPGIHFGVMRSSINSTQKLKELLKKLSILNHIKLKGIMGYEAQVAGLGDNVTGGGLKNTAIKFLQKKSIVEFTKRRKECVELIKNEGFDIDLVNGGGTGSLETTIQENWVTEVTVGSGFFSPTLFDYYTAFKHQPSAFFALPVVRAPENGIVTCLGGGYLASGSADKLRLPQPYLPEGLKLTTNEGAGEVQTPLILGNNKLNIGDVVFFRHTKAGELCERFNELILIKDNKYHSTINTYRGDNQCFL